MSEVVNATTRQRHVSIFDEYIRLMAHYGNQARTIPKKTLYNEVAQNTGYSIDHVKHVIFKKFKETSCSRAK
jgi:hypothetical protein